MIGWAREIGECRGPAIEPWAVARHRVLLVLAPVQRASRAGWGGAAICGGAKKGGGEPGGWKGESLVQTCHSVSDWETLAFVEEERQPRRSYHVGRDPQLDPCAGLHSSEHPEGRISSLP
ncbi:hypothetical protein NDU88_000824 [Pleurodeles waltl]|uniref:Uncharacterized protein n=1 Tax=Pleurodeles waltl TaxID=8319 RepID=A0AAV7Q559_PLEWA|nr:hypothetical protein NDU88_000824 [Pleurodeles waltl]